jgi:hypothetical protein
MSTEFPYQKDEVQPEIAAAWDEAFATIKRLALEVSDKHREELIEFVRYPEGFCSSCGTKHLPCYCWNDE